MKIKSGRVITVSILGAMVASAAYAESRIQFSPIPNQKELHTLVVRIESTKISTVTVTDIYLDIVSWEADSKGIFVAPNQVGRDPFQWDFFAALSVVAGGKLYRDGGGMCSPWENDISVCTVECDGGQFQLRRELGEEFHRISAILAPMPELIENDQSSAVRIGGCSDEDDEILLDVSVGHQAIVTFSRWAR